MSSMQEQPTGGVSPNARENGQIRQSKHRADVGNVRSHPPSRTWAFQPVQKTATIHVSSGFIWGIPVLEGRVPCNRQETSLVDRRYTPLLMRFRLDFGRWKRVRNPKLLDCEQRMRSSRRRSKLSATAKWNVSKSVESLSKYSLPLVQRAVFVGGNGASAFLG